MKPSRVKKNKKKKEKNILKLLIIASQTVCEETVTVPSSTQKKPQSTIKKSFLLQNRGSHRLTTSFSLQLAEEALFFLSRDVKTELHVQTDGLNDERSALYYRACAGCRVVLLM